MVPLDDASVDELTERASVVRSRLASALGALDERRHHLQDDAARVRRGARVLAVLGAAVALGGAGALLYRAWTAPARRARARWRLAERAWRQPESLGEPGMLEAIVRSVVIGVGTAAVRGVLVAAWERAGRLGADHAAAVPALPEPAPAFPAPALPAPTSALPSPHRDGTRVTR